MNASKAPRAKIPAKIMVTNITHKNGGAGVFLDPGEVYGNKILGPGRSMTFDCVGGVLPDVLEVWGNMVAVYDAEKGTEVLGAGGGELTPGTVSPVREMAGAVDGDPKDDDFLEDEEPNLDSAIDAVMPGGQMPAERTGPISGDLRQQAPPPRARVSLGSRSDEVIGAELSPIPGDRPRDLDNSQQYTIKAPRANHVGGIIGKK
jgi:hypothetical protein